MPQTIVMPPATHNRNALRTEPPYDIRNPEINDKDGGPATIVNAFKSLHTSTSNDTITDRKRVSPAMQRFAARPLRRSSSRIERWVQNQKVLRTEGEGPPDTPDDAEPPSRESNCHPYLAYPHMIHPRPHRTSTDTAILIRGQDEEDSRRESDAQVLKSVENTPSTPCKSHNRSESNGNAFATPSPSRRRLNLTFTQHTRKASGADSVASSSVASLFHHHRPASTIDAHTVTPSKRDSHFCASAFPQNLSRISSPEGIVSLDSPSPTCKRTGTRVRPTVLGHFTRSIVEGQTTADDSSPSPSPPRPSTSSIFTRSSASVSTSATSYAQSSVEALGTSPSKFSLGSFRSRSPTSLFRSSPSLWSLPTDASHMNDPPSSTKVIAKDNNNEKRSPHVAHPVRGQSGSVLGFGSVSQMLASPKRRKKRKLIITGVPVGDQRRIDALRKWCESFGEVNQITRIPNGDLHIDFKRSEVADTVCRLHARVYIGGVGSVGLSWFSGKRP